MAWSRPRRNPANDHIVMFEWKQPQSSCVVCVSAGALCFSLPEKNFLSWAEVCNKMQLLNFLPSCVISLWIKDNLCVHCTPACSLLRNPNCNCEGMLSLLITAAAEGLIIVNNFARLKVHNCVELLWEGLIIFTGGLLKYFSSSCLAHKNEKWKLKWKEILLSVVIITSTPTHSHPRV